MNAHEIAKACAEVLWKEDRASSWLGMKLLDVAPGYAKLNLHIKQHHCNGHGICHGGISFALADSCFAFACNSYDERTVGKHNVVSYLRPIFIDDLIVATAKEVSRTKNSGIYDITLSNQKAAVCVEMRGFSHRIEGKILV